VIEMEREEIQNAEFKMRNLIPCLCKQDMP
jgi:hypothetical protein